MNPSILLIEDDDISRCFLSEALALLDIGLIACPDFSGASAALASRTFTLIISDLHLPDGELLSQAAGFPKDVPVLAISAEVTPAIRERLAGIGIHDILAKPMPITDLHDAVRRLCTMPPVLFDENKALRALGGSTEALRNMRLMFLSELPELAALIQSAFDDGNPAAVHDALHKLKASCGFLGAEHLLAACRLFDSQPTAESMKAFQASAADTQAFIRARVD